MNVLIAGNRLGPYELIRPLGAGGMGTVWEVERADVISDAASEEESSWYQVTHAPQRVSRRFAAKIFNPSFHHYLGRELEIHPTLKSEYIVRVEEVLHLASGPILIMELADRSMADVLTGPSGEVLVFPESICIQKMLDVARGLAYLHERRIVHRDIKPLNILMFGDSSKLADLGISRFVEYTLSTHTGGMTRPYAAPEMLTYRPQVGLASDIWAFGVSFYEALVGKLPYWPMFTPGASVRALHGVSEKVADLIKACLRHDPKSRPSVEQIVHQLQDFALIEARSNQLEQWRACISTDLPKAVRWIIDAKIRTPLWSHDLEGALEFLVKSGSRVAKGQDVLHYEVITPMGIGDGTAQAGADGWLYFEAASPEQIEGSSGRDLMMHVFSQPLMLEELPANDSFLSWTDPRRP